MLCSRERTEPEHHLTVRRGEVETVWSVGGRSRDYGGGEVKVPWEAGGKKAAK